MPDPNTEADQDRLRWLFLQSQGGAQDSPAAQPTRMDAARTALRERIDRLGRGEGMMEPTSGERATQALLQGGVRTDLAMSADERLRLGQGVDDIDAATRILNARPGALGRQITGGITVARDPASGHLIGTDPSQPEGQQRFFVNRPGLDLPDIAGAVPDITVGATGALAGVTGGMLASPAGPGAAITAGALSEAVGTSWARYEQFRAGQRSGAVDPALTPLDLWQRTLPEAALNGLMNLGVGVAYRVFRAVAGRHAPDLTIEEFERRLAQARSETAVAGEGAEPTSAQVLAGTPAGDLLTQQQQRLAREAGPSGQAIRERLDAQARGVVTAEERLAERTLPGVDRAATTPRVAGEEVRRTVAEEHGRLVDEVLDAANTVRTGARDAAETGGALRTSFQRAQDAFDANAARLYDELRREVGDVAGVPENTMRFAAERGAALDAQVIPGLNPAERRVIGGILERNTVRTAPSALVDEAGAPLRAGTTAPREVTFEQLNKDISELNRLIRRVSRGPQSGEAHPEIETLRALRDAMMADREGVLTAVGRTDALERLREINTWYRGENDRLARGIVDRITRTQPGGAYDVVPDEQIARQLLARREDARLVAELAADPQYQRELAPVMDAMRAALRDEWRREAVNARTGLVNLDGHARFMERNGDRLGTFFSPEDAARFNQPAALAGQLERREQQWRAMIGGLEVERGTGRMLADVAPTPDGVFRHVWTGQPDPGIVRQVTGALTEAARRGDPGPLESFRGAILRDVQENVLQGAGQSATGRARVDPAALSAYVRTHGEALTEALGRDYVTGLRQIATAAERFEAGAREVSPTTRRTAIYWLSRIVFAPFSTAGRLMTAGVRGGESAESAALRRVLLDPEAMRRAVQMRNVTAREAVEWAIAGGLIPDAVEALQ